MSSGSHTPCSAHRPRFQGDGLPVLCVLGRPHPHSGAGLQRRAHGALHLRRLSGPGEQAGLAVGRVRRQPQVQHQVPEQLPGIQERKQRPAGTGRRSQHQRGHQGEPFQPGRQVCRRSSPSTHTAIPGGISFFQPTFLGQQLWIVTGKQGRVLGVSGAGQLVGDQGGDRPG